MATATTVLSKADLLKSIGRRDERKPGQLYRLTDDGDGIARDMSAAPNFEEEFVAAAVINTPAVDAENDVIIPTGVDFKARYAANPVVCWEHNMGDLAFPVGTSRAPDGSLAIDVRPERTVARCFFDKEIPESRQVAALVRNRIINATSIHVLPNSVSRAMATDGSPVRVIEASEMVEWSWGIIPVNPETVRRCLDLDRIEGEQLCEGLRKSLLPYAASAKKNQVRGVDLGSQRTPEKTQPSSEPIIVTQQLKVLTESVARTMKPSEVAAALLERDQYDEDSRQLLGKEAVAKGMSGFSADDLGSATKMADLDKAFAAKMGGHDDEDETADKGYGGNEDMKDDAEGEDTTTPESVEAEVDENAEDKQEADAGEMKLGEQVATGLFRAIDAIKGELESKMGPLENERTKAMAEDALARLQEMSDTVSGFVKSEYGSDAGAVAETIEPAAKHWLAVNQNKQFQLQGVAMRLESLGSAKTISPEDLRQVSQSIGKLVGEAKAFKPGANDPAEVEALKKSLKAKEAELEAAKKSLGEVTDAYLKLAAKVEDVLPAAGAAA